jgi:hypothetical protein
MFRAAMTIVVRRYPRWGKDGDEHRMFAHDLKSVSAPEAEMTDQFSTLQRSITQPTDHSLRTIRNSLRRKRNRFSGAR